ncbi:hypothetical protein [Spongiibacter marinus]|uniref:hypothetical protein n=1 Tax=Spongiibacter marinus TaxID=354246 RepID=UPI0004047390|nr:hypothetical protein [Spongiibacter marinus]
MDNKRNSCSSDETSEQEIVVVEQKKMVREFRSRTKTPEEIPYDPDAISIVIPVTGKKTTGNTRRFTLTTPGEDKYVDLIFKVANAAAYVIFIKSPREYSQAVRDNFADAIRLLVEFINLRSASEGSGIALYKEFEEWRLNDGKVKTHSSRLSQIKKMIFIALAFDPFSKTIDSKERAYLRSQGETNAVPANHSDKESYTINRWLSEHDWLRDEVVGVGHDTYSLLASPKVVVKSIKITAATIMLEMQHCKMALIDFFREEKIILNDPTLISNSDFGKRFQARLARQYCNAENVASIQRAYNKKRRCNPYLDMAIRIFVRMSTSDGYDYQERQIKNFFSNRPFKARLDGVMVMDSMFNVTNAWGFNIKFIMELIDYAALPGEVAEISQIPICEGENLLFGWLMGSLTVQQSDIYKLKYSSFTYMRRRTGQVTHISLRYYKGRAKRSLDVEDIDANSLLGRAVFGHLSAFGASAGVGAYVSWSPKMKEVNGEFFRMIENFNHEFRPKVLASLKSEGSVPVFLNCLSALVSNGEKYCAKTRAHENSSTPLKKSLFAPNSIKTAAVYARSDTFDPSSLMNYHSHSDRTERNAYLTKENEEWMNNAGRITRAVMQDFAINLFRPSKQDLQNFNSEFSKALKTIDSRSKEALVRMKVVTGKSSGDIKNFGVAESYQMQSNREQEVYILDDAYSIVKYMHFLAQLDEKHKLLIRRSPEFLFNEALPTAEWIEQLFDRKVFSMESISKAEVIYSQYKDSLPPLFSSQIRV